MPLVRTLGANLPGVRVDVASRREVVGASVVRRRMHVALHMRTVALGVAAGAKRRQLRAKRSAIASRDSGVNARASSCLASFIMPPLWWCQSLNSRWCWGACKSSRRGAICPRPRQFGGQVWRPEYSKGATAPMALFLCPRYVRVPASMVGVQGSLRAGRFPFEPVRQPCTSATQPQRLGGSFRINCRGGV